MIEVSLFLILLDGLSTLGAGVAESAALDASSTTTTIGASEGKVDQLLRVQTDDKAGDIDDVLTNTDVALTDQDASVMDALGESELEDLGLKTAFQEIFNLQAEDVIQLVLLLLQDTNADEAANEGIAFEETLGILLVQGQ